MKDLYLYPGLEPQTAIYPCNDIVLQIYLELTRESDPFHMTSVDPLES